MHYLILWIPFMLLISFVLLGMTYIEGSKITTTEYLGLDDVGPILTLFIGCIIGFIIYPITFLPFTILFSLLHVSTKLKVWFALLIGLVAGYILFYFSYPTELIHEYRLSPFTSSLPFGLAAIIYVFIEQSVRKNISWQ